MNKEKNKSNKKIENVENYDKISLKDYKFTIVLLVVIALFVGFTPLIFKGIRYLNENNIIENLFSKNEAIKNEDNKDNENKNEVVVANYDKSGASVPVLKDGMIPVRYNYIENKWVKANSENPATNIWYNYATGEWANAILVKESGTKTRKYYEAANPDTIINDEDILAFFVWIPRYKYSLVSGVGIQQIDITFEDTKTQKSTGPNYITHPAFTLGNKELPGFWIGKFEITGGINYMTVLPNQNAVTNQNISSVYNTLSGFYSNSYGLTKEDSEVRLLRNTEWGAVTYLTNSKYGICSNDKCETMSTYNFDYSSLDGQKSSTTGNINGVYAMNGSVMEYVMGNNNNLIGDSGFDNVWMSTNKNYFDFYKDGLENDYSRAILGDATNEFGPFTNNKSSWNSSHSVFVDSTNPWFIRDINNSIYSFSKYTGGAHASVGFRLSIN